MATSLTQTDVDRLEKAITRGVLRVEYADHSVTYQSIDKMMKALAYARQQLAGPADRRPPSTYAVFDRE
ncbi:hypothetical protein RA307_31395 [Xanthobacteraceae bacterium Astr-EGSB]|uniref:phage head-tail joining protein n=1 Tax=Astrobacterium formosum TaxID=3069710 RepID=UPI0027B86F1D|nr:hypothetical protein [Xanthobacteraceae bacterium Astr-EGSB]